MKSSKITLRLILRWLRIYGPTLLICVSFVPLLAVFFSYTYTRGIADSFGAPEDLVRPDPTKIYEALFYFVPAMLFVIPAVLSTTPAFLNSTGTNKSNDTISTENHSRKFQIVKIVILRAAIAIISGSAFYFYVAPRYDDPNLIKTISISSASIFAVIVGPLIASIVWRLIKHEDWLPTKPFPIQNIEGWAIGAALFIYFTATAYTTGKTASTDRVHFVLPGIDPEVILFTSYDGFATARIDLKNCGLHSCPVLPDYRWREWKEHRLITKTKTGILTLPKLSLPNDKRLYTDDPDQKSK